MDCAGAHLVVDSGRRLRETGRNLFLVVVDRGPIDRLLALLGLSHHLSVLNSHDKRERVSKCAGLCATAAKDARYGRLGTWAVRDGAAERWRGVEQA